MGLIVVETTAEVTALAEAIADPTLAGQAIVGLTCRRGEDHPTLDPEAVLEIVGDSARVYLIKDHLTRELAERLPPRMEVYGGAARVWWPPVPQGADPHDHPLILDPTGVYGARSMERLRSEVAAREADDALGVVQRLEREISELRAALQQARTQAAEAARRSRKSKRKRPSEPAGSEQAEVDPTTAFRVALHEAWLDAFAEEDRNRYPLGAYTIGARFVDTLAGQPSDVRRRAAWASAMAVSGRAAELRGLQLHRMRSSAAPAAPHLVRSRDGAVAWRCAVQPGAPGTPRLHYWRRSDGVIELAGVGPHNNFSVPE